VGGAHGLLQFKFGGFHPRDIQKRPDPPAPAVEQGAGALIPENTRRAEKDAEMPDFECQKQLDRGNLR
jgi:hypothetical protein